MVLIETTTKTGMASDGAPRTRVRELCGARNIMWTGVVVVRHIEKVVRRAGEELRQGF